MTGPIRWSELVADGPDFSDVTGGGSTSAGPPPPIRFDDLVQDDAHRTLTRATFGPVEGTRPVPVVAPPPIGTPGPLGTLAEMGRQTLGAGQELGQSIADLGAGFSRAAGKTLFSREGPARLAAALGHVVTNTAEGGTLAPPAIAGMLRAARTSVDPAYAAQHLDDDFGGASDPRVMATREAYRTGVNDPMERALGVTPLSNRPDAGSLDFAGQFVLPVLGEGLADALARRVGPTAITQATAAGLDRGLTQAPQGAEALRYALEEAGLRPPVEAPAAPPKAVPINPIQKLPEEMTPAETEVGRAIEGLAKAERAKAGGERVHPEAQAALDQRHAEALARLEQPPEPPPSAVVPEPAPPAPTPDRRPAEPPVPKATPSPVKTINRVQRTGADSRVHYSDGTTEVFPGLSVGKARRSAQAKLDGGVEVAPGQWAVPRTDPSAANLDEPPPITYTGKKLTAGGREKPRAPMAKRTREDLYHHLADDLAYLQRGNPSGEYVGQSSYGETVVGRAGGGLGASMMEDAAARVDALYAELARRGESEAQVNANLDDFIAARDERIGMVKDHGPGVRQSPRDDTPFSWKSLTNERGALGDADLFGDTSHAPPPEERPSLFDEASAGKRVPSQAPQGMTAALERARALVADPKEAFLAKHGRASQAYTEARALLARAEKIGPTELTARLDDVRGEAKPSAPPPPEEDGGLFGMLRNERGALGDRGSQKLPKKLYRGVSDDGEGVGTFALGKGLYSSRSKSFASKFGTRVVEVPPDQGWPKNPLIIDNVAGGASHAFTDWLLEKSGAKSIREFNRQWADPGDFVRSLGYDGVVAGNEIVRYPDAPKGQQGRPTLSPEPPDITGNERGALGVPNGPGFRSRLVESVRKAKMEKAPAQTWVSKLRGQGHSADEFDWALGGALAADPKRQWTKAELLDLAETRGYGALTETVRRGPTTQIEWIPEGDGNNQWRLQFGERRWGTAVQSDDGTVTVTVPYGIKRKYANLHEAKASQAYVAESEGRKLSDAPKFGDRTEPGGSNYREVLLQLPGQGFPRRGEVLFREVIDRAKATLARERPGAEWSRLSAEERTARTDAAAQALETEPQPFLSSHWEEPNVLAHIRLNDRIGPNGEKILHVEEIQSDWHQKGRKYGYSADPEKTKRIEKDLGDAISGMTDAEMAAIARQAAQLPPVEHGQPDRVKLHLETARGGHAPAVETLQWDFPYEGSNWTITLNPHVNKFVVNGMRGQVQHARTSDFADALEVIRDYVARSRVGEDAGILEARRRVGDLRRASAIAREEVPNAPLKETPEWMGLAMKRVLDEAVAGGYERVSWTPGERQAARYDLSRVADRIEYNPQSGKLTVTDHHGENIHRGDYERTALADVIGKEATDRLLATPLRSELPGDTPTHLLTGQDIKVGGEGMRAFYDRMLPDWIKGYAKKLGVRLELGEAPVFPNDTTPRFTVSDGDLADYMDNRWVAEFGDYRDLHPPERRFVDAMAEFTSNEHSEPHSEEYFRREWDNAAGVHNVPAEYREQGWRLIRQHMEGERNPPSRGPLAPSFAVTPELRAAIGQGQTYGKGGVKYLTGLTGAGVGATVGAKLDDKHPVRGAVIGGLAGALGGVRLGQWIEPQAAKTLTENPDGLMDGVRRIFAPETRTPKAEMAGRTIRAGLGKGALDYFRVQHALTEAGRGIEKLPIAEQRAMIDALEAGAKQPNPKLQPLADALRKALDDGRTAVQALGTGKLETFITDYFPHVWEDPKAAADAFRKADARRPLQGARSFLKKRSIPTTADGRALGLRPVSENPVDLALLKLREMNKYVTAHRIMQDLRSQGLLQYVRVSDPIPEGMSRINDNVAVVYGPPTVQVKEAYDAGLRGQLESIMQALKVQHTRGPKVAGHPSWWGAATADKLVQTKFAGDVTVIEHELGHILDHRYGLWDKLTKIPGTDKAAIAARKTVHGELRALADLRYEGGPTSPNFAKYVRKRPEKVANAVHALIYAPERMKAVAPTIYEKLRRTLQGYPELKPLLSLKKSLVMGTDATEIPVGGLVTMGQYMGPEPVVRLLNNHLAPGLRGQPLFDAYMGLGNTMNQLQLGLSAFHLGFTSMDAATSRTAAAVNDLRHGKLLSAARTAASVPAAPFTTYLKGAKLMRAAAEPGGASAELLKLVDGVAAGGGRFAMDRFYKNDNLQAFRTAMGRKEYGAAAKVFLPATIERSSAWLMEHIVPRQKLGVFADLAERELARLGPNADPDAVREAMGKVWDSVDNRMGQLVYDNLFWDRAFKDLAQASVRSVGWNLGTVREVGGGLTDLIQGKFGHKTDYIVALPITVGLTGAVIHYLYTGEAPAELKDYFFPKTGRLNDEGNPERVELPSYMKDVNAYLRHPVSTLGHKVHPMIGLVADMLQNEDFFGNQIRNADDPLVQQLQQVAGYVGQQALPFGVRNALEERSRRQSPAAQIGPLVGVTPAKREDTRTPAQNRMMDMIARRLPTGATPEEVEQRNVRRRYADAVKNGTTDQLSDADRAAVAALPKLSFQALVRRTRTPVMDGRFQQLTPIEAAQVWNLATPQEKQRWAPLFTAKLTNADPRTRAAALAELTTTAP